MDHHHRRRVGVWPAGEKIRPCAAVGEIAAGILLGPSALGLIWPADWPVLFPVATQTSMQLLGKLGLIFLLFQVGMEFDYGHLRSRSKTITAVSLLGMAAPVLCGLAIGPWLHKNFAPETPWLGFQLFLCVALSISALPIMGRILLEMKLERTAVGAMAISTAAIDDVVGWIFLGVATVLATDNFNAWHLLFQIIGIVAFFASLQKMIGPWLLNIWRTKFPTHKKKECRIRFSRCCSSRCLRAVWRRIIRHLCHLWRVSVWHVPASGTGSGQGVARPFFRGGDGRVRADFFHKHRAEHKIGSLQTPMAWFACGLVLLAAVVGKLGGCYLGARLTGQPPRVAASIAALMNTRALMGLIAINVGLDLKLLTPELFTMFVIMALLTTAMCGPLLRWWLPKELRKLVPD